MKKAKTIGILAGILTAAATYTGAAQAGVDGGSAGLLLGYGFKDGVGLGFGARGGYTFPFNLYLGGTFVYHLGKSESTPAGDVSVNIMYLGLEGGYDIEAGPVVVRPYLGLGDVIAHASVPCVTIPGAGCIGGGSDSAGHFGVWPGATVIYPIDNFFVGGDARFVVVTGDNVDFNAFSIFATGGMKF